MNELQPPDTELKASLEQNFEQDVDVSVTEAKQPNSEKNSQQSWLGLLLFISVAIIGESKWKHVS
ncbi:MAG: hypothetical protein QNJ63_06565 [Calothrix sp. MO_192.B10]|nr:hypothetical protein [Calothrix sp. MO_192.B10]